MDDLRGELREYAAKDEPAMRLEFGEVLAAARRSQRRRRTGVIVSCAAAVAVVAAGIPILLTSTAAPGPPPATGLARCAPEPEPVKRLSCVLKELVPPLLPPGAQVLPSPLASYRSPGSAAWDVVAATMPRGGQSVREYQADVIVPDPVGSILITAHSAGGPAACQSREPCGHPDGPHGEKIVVNRHGTGAVANGKLTAVSAYRDGVMINIQVSNATQLVNGGPMVGGPPDGLLSLDDMVQVVTTPELRP